MQKAARKCDRDSTKKEPEKLETQWGKAGIHELLTAFLLAGRSCAIKLGLPPTMAVDSYAFHPAKRLAQASGS